MVEVEVDGKIVTFPIACYIINKFGEIRFGRKGRLFLGRKKKEVEREQVEEVYSCLYIRCPSKWHNARLYHQQLHPFRSLYSYAHAAQCHLAHSSVVYLGLGFNFRWPLLLSPVCSSRALPVKVMTFLPSSGPACPQAGA